jgi:hypothetical protein
VALVVLLTLHQVQMVLDIVQIQLLVLALIRLLGRKVVMALCQETL